ncbi:hypothetical protein CRUP_017745 [Coryphaenoides rupestris]|nr:hypothetical protein CRUP_017745 [Coryphaenoides rupestris]
MWWFQQGMCFLPALLVVWSSSNFIISYIVAIYRHDVDVIFPYIRYKFVQRLSEELHTLPSRMNTVVFGVGVLSCVGMCVVATFQETTLTAVHDTGALLFFITGVLYAVLQAAMSYKIRPLGSSVHVSHVRTAIAVLAAVSEWIVTFGFVSFFLTFIPDFKGSVRGQRRSGRVVQSLKDDSLPPLSSSSSSSSPPGPPLVLCPASGTGASGVLLSW